MARQHLGFASATSPKHPSIFLFLFLLLWPCLFLSLYFPKPPSLNCFFLLFISSLYVLSPSLFSPPASINATPFSSITEQPVVQRSLHLVCLDRIASLKLRRRLLKPLYTHFSISRGSYIESINIGVFCLSGIAAPPPWPRLISHHFMIWFVSFILFACYAFSILLITSFNAQH